MVGIQTSLGNGLWKRLIHQPAGLKLNGKYCLVEKNARSTKRMEGSFSNESNKNQ